MASNCLLQDIQAFLKHCYRSLDIRTVANADVMRLIMVAHELECKLLLEECDQLLVERSEHRPFAFFADLSNGGDMVDWIKLCDHLGLKKAGSICEMHLVRHLKVSPEGQESSRMQELGQECLLRVINKFAQLWDVENPGLLISEISSLCQADLNTWISISAEFSISGAENRALWYLPNLFNCLLAMPQLSSC